MNTEIFLELYYALFLSINNGIPGTYDNNLNLLQRFQIETMKN